MKQLEIFLEKLRNAGYQVITNWQKELHRKQIFEYITIKGKIGFTTVIFHIYGEEEGYSMYIESKGTTFDDDMKIISGIID